MAPGLQRIRTEPAPKRHATDLRHDTAGDNLALELRDRQVRERYAMAGGDLTGQPLNLDDDAGGKAGWAPAAGLFVQPGEAFEEEPVPPLADDLPRRIEAGGDHIVPDVLGGEQDDLGANHVTIR